eukprot:3459467-Prymnesium_polylepis.1
MFFGHFLRSAGVKSIISLNSSACRSLPMSITEGNSWHGCRCSPWRIASRISAASSSGTHGFPRQAARARMSR